MNLYQKLGHPTQKKMLLEVMKVWLKALEAKTRPMRMDTDFFPKAPSF